MKNVLMILICAFFILSCGNSSNNEITKSDSSASKQVDYSKDEQAIKNLIEAGQTQFNTADSTAIIATISDDFEIIPAGQPPVRGEAAKKWVRDVLRTNNIQIKPYSNVEVGISEDLGYYRYDFDWTVTPKTGGQPMSEKGSGIILLRKQPSGEWRLIKDIWTPLPATK